VPKLILIGKLCVIQVIADPPGFRGLTGPPRVLEIHEQKAVTRGRRCGDGQSTLGFVVCRSRSTTVGLCDREPGRNRENGGGADDRKYAPGKQRQRSNLSRRVYDWEFRNRHTVAKQSLRPPRPPTERWARRRCGRSHVSPLRSER
jgi:hypothetical protein